MHLILLRVYVDVAVGREKLTDEVKLGQKQLPEQIPRFEKIKNELNSAFISNRLNHEPKWVNKPANRKTKKLENAIRTDRMNLNESKII